MPLTLVLGPANSAKAGEVLGAFADASRGGALLVVPTAHDAEHYSRELAEQGCVLRSALTFAGLTAEIARRCGYRAARLTPLQRDRLVRRAIGGCSLRSLNDVSQTTGFADAAARMFGELERSMVSPARFTAAMRRWAESNPGRATYAGDLSALYGSYAGELERLGYVDSELFTWRALDALRADPGAWGRAPVFFYGFDDLHELQRDAIETLSRVVGVPVMVSLTFEAGRAATMARAGVVEDLRPLAQRVVELPGLDDYYEPQGRAALHHLERSLFEPDGWRERPDPGPAIRLLEAAGELAEAELVAAEIRSLLDAGMAPEQIAVVYRTIPPAGALIATFERYGVPVQIERKPRFGHTPLGSGMLALARLAWSGSPRGGAAEALRYLRTPGLLNRPEIADGLEVAIRCDGLSTLEEARERLGLEIAEVESLRGSDDPVRELARHARRLLAAPRRRQAAILGRRERLDVSAAAALQSLWVELEELSYRPSRHELLELLEQLEVTVEHLSSTAGVLVTDPLSIRARRYRAVFVCGLGEGAFPLPPRSDPFLPDEHRRELAAAAGLRLRLQEDALDRERYLFYACVSRASQRVILSYRSSDEEGNLALGSPFIDDVADVLDPAWRQRRRRRLLSDVVWSVAEAPTERERERALAAEGARGVSCAPADEGAQAASCAPPAEGAQTAVRRLGERALALVRHTKVVSAGALENYAECALKWLVERELDPRRLEPESEPLARGSYMHDVLEQVLGRLGQAVRPESLPDALRALEEVLARQEPRIAVGAAEPLRKAAAAMIAADLRRYLEHEARTGCGWRPHALELRFGFDEEQSLPPLVLSGDGAEVKVRGAIDRVDVSPDGQTAVVRDYKSGSARSEHQGSRWGVDQRLQVALYMVAVRELLGLDPVAGLYQPLGGRDLRARGLYLDGAPVGAELVSRDARDAGELRAELDQACARASALAARLRAGDLVPCPETCSRQGCAYPGICRSTG